MIDPAQVMSDAIIARPAPDALEIRRVFTVAPAVLWSMFTDPAHFSRWWGPRHMRCEECEIDLRVGGKWRVRMINEDSGSAHALGGEYEVIEAPHRLVYSWVWQGEGASGPASRVTLEFAARGRGSELRIFHERLPEEHAPNYQNGWMGALDSLAELLAETASDSKED